MAVSLDAVDDVFAALADPMRRRLLDRLAAHGEATATVLGGELPVSRQAVVQHLAVLEQVELVRSRRTGRERRYTVQPERLTLTAGWMIEVAAQWDGRLAAIKMLAEASGPTVSAGDAPGQPSPAAPDR
jgi:DNA-binding transcriptional ArsR family regulator